MASSLLTDFVDVCVFYRFKKKRFYDHENASIFIKLLLWSWQITEK